MQVTLRKARQIEKLLTKKFNEHIEQGSSISIHENLDSLSQTMRESLIEFSDSVALLETMNTAIFTLREDISKANEANGINGLILERAKLKSLLSRLQQYSDIDTMESEVIIKRKIEADRSSTPTNVYGSTRDEYMLNKCSVGQLDSIKHHIDSLKQDIVRLDDMILANNVTVTIIIPPDVVGLLGMLNIPH